MDINSWPSNPSLDDFIDLEFNSLPIFDLDLSDSLLESTCVADLNDLMDQSASPLLGATSLHQQLEMFAHTDIENWSSEDCFDWAYTTSQEGNLQGATQDTQCTIGAFKFTTGREMLGYTRQDFNSLTDIYTGPFFYEKFREIVNKRRQEKQQQGLGEEAGSSSFTTLQNMEYPSLDQSSLFSYPIQPCQLSPYEHDFSNSSDTYRTPSDILDSSFDNSLDGQTDQFSINYNTTDGCYSGSSYQNQWSMEKELSGLNLGDAAKSVEYSLPDENSNNYHCGSSPISISVRLPKVQRQEKKQKTKQAAASSEDFLTSSHWFQKMKTGGPRKNRVRSPKSWEFVIRLLQDSRTNPRLVEWENEDEGVFRLKQKEIISRMWGGRTTTNGNGEPLAYESFARLLRHHYRSNTLLPVREKQMVYKFGPEVLQAIKDGKKF